MFFSFFLHLVIIWSKQRNCVCLLLLRGGGGCLLCNYAWALFVLLWIFPAVSLFQTFISFSPLSLENCFYCDIIMCAMLRSLPAAWPPYTNIQEILQSHKNHLPSLFCFFFVLFFNPAPSLFVVRLETRPSKMIFFRLFSSCMFKRGLFLEKKVLKCFCNGSALGMKKNRETVF